jgi:hypothetical protein
MVRKIERNRAIAARLVLAMMSGFDEDMLGLIAMASHAV